ncbi:T9SS type A sorting domain-containing protein [uncultured Dokdonia sp.]|uniref:T9SS type A sorting domain-containing protein n=1 Tax=uncultured Dokdonia sp. TaxID=575653 RepID=UPI0026176462|nr:T9SS type A sorting domain-containing protein [uncultured Dokdonia sp.]
MKKKLFNVSLWLIMVLFTISVNAQADPVFTSLEPSAQAVTITNAGDTTVDIGSYQLCTNGFRYDSVGSLTTESTMLAAGASITVTWNDIPTNGSGTLMLFTNSSFSSSNPNILRDYVRWGTGAGFRLAQGVNSGRWSRSTASVSFTCPPSDVSGIINTGGTRGGSPGAWGDADAGVISLDVNATNAAGGNTTRIQGEFEVSICVDGNPDPVVVNHVTDATRSYLYVITDDSEEETILNIVATNEISLDGAGVGNCQIWGWSYSGLGGQAGALATFGGGPLQALRDADCSDISQESITVIREAANAGTIGIDVAATEAAGGNTTRITGEFDVNICVDGNPDPIVVFHDTPSVNLSYNYVITDATTDDDTILAIVATNEISLDGAGVGVCDIWGWSYRGLDNDSFIGMPLQSLRDADCSDISADRIRVTREEADAGTIGIDVAATEAAGGNTTRITGEFDVNICVDGNPDPIVVFHDTPSVNLSYNYVITDATTDDDTILAIVATNEISLDGAGVGVCDIWGWSYRGLDNDSFIGMPLQSLRDADCSDISADRIRVTREEADAGTIGIDVEATEAAGGNTVRIDGDFDVSICVDGNPDPIVVFHDTPSVNLSYNYVITDATTDDDTILAIVATNEISLDGAGVGVCDIWGWSYRGLDNDSFIGMPLQSLRDADCSDISADRIRVTREEADAGTIGIDVEATEAAGGNTVRIDGDFDVSICVDGNPDPIVVFHETPSVNLSYNYVITDATTDNETILAIVATNEISLDGAGVGVCDIWGWSYRGLDNDSFIGMPLQSLRDADCSDISEDRIRVTREEADAGIIGIDVEATEAAGGNTVRIDGDFDVSICVDGNPDPIVVFHETPAENLSYNYVITDATTDNETILAIVATNEISLDGAGVGVCDIWGWSYRGLDNDSFIGMPLQALRDADCSDISEDRIRVTREEADAGIIGIDVEATEAAGGNTVRIDGDFDVSICVDGNPDPIVVFHETPAENLSYNYVITDATTDNETILAIVATNEISLDGAGVGVCDIWGWSYRGLDNDSFIGMPLQALRDADCSDISEDRIRVTREEADAGIIGIDVEATEAAGGNTVRIDGDFDVSICVDGNPDPIVVFHETPAENLSYNYVITDATTDDDTILAIVATNEISLDGAGVGVCDIWGWSYRGLDNDSFIGMPLQALRDADCSDISEDRIRVTREAADVDSTISIDLEATGNPNGTTTFEDDFVAIICGDTQADPLVIDVDTTGSELPYYLLVFNFETSLIEDIILTTDNSSVVDLNGITNSEFEIFGLSGVLPNDGQDIIGQEFDVIFEFVDSGCLALSLNSVFVLREVADGGTVAIDLEATGNPNGTTTFNGDTEAVICLDSQADPIVVVHENDSPNLSYRYVITDAETGLILNVVATNSIDLNAVEAGTCEIWGWSYRGVPGNGLDQIGEPLSALDDLDCSDISDNAITVIREAADGGTVSVDIDATETIGENTTIVTGDNSVTILVGDGIPNPIVVQHENDSPNLTFQYVITDTDDAETILGITNSSEIDLEGAGLGTCAIWGWSYRGLGASIPDFIGQPLQVLRDEDCSDISEDFVEVIRTDVLAVEDNQVDVNLSMYPNPTTSFLNISLGGVNNGYAINVYSITGQVVMSEQFTAQDNTLDVSRLSDGMYLLEVIDEASSIRTIKRFVKR